MNISVQRVEDILTSPYRVENYTDLIREIFPSVKIVAPDRFKKEYTNFSSHIEGSAHVGTYTDPDGKTLIIHAVQLKRETYVETSRSTQRSYAKKLIEAGNADAALIAFYTEGDPKWRVSFVRLDYEIKFENEKLNTSENLTPAKRYSYLVGKDEPCHTAISRFHRFIIDDPNAAQPTLDDLEEAFSVEKVTEEFFSLYCEKFHELREALEKNADFVIEAQQHNFTSAQFAKKLMGQIVFLYFLQKKGWLGVPAWPNELDEKEYKNAFFARGAKSRELIPKVYFPLTNGNYKLSGKALRELSDDDERVLASCVKGQPWGNGSKKFMRVLYDFAQKRNANFFDDYLEPLFYNALNVNRGEQGYDPELHCRIPFLSGGLFEPIDDYDWEHNNFNIPNSIFSNKDEKGERDADGILDIFDRYNFTMSEDEPMEREVAIDPEMLGKVFENLLEVNDRKSKGAFYTPREIVHYMCQETLISYLVRETGLSEPDIRDFILMGDFMKDEDTSKEKRQGNGGMYISEDIFLIDETGNVVVNRLKDIDTALANIRVVDPAVGSGAFPLGMLNEIVRARQNISAYMAITMNPYEKRMMYNNERSPYSLKVQTIKNCIFAADIEPSAVDIAQLRLWLSLVIDDEINPNAKSPLDGHKNPIPLPNLECNILCGNSLIDEFEGIKLVNYSDILGNNAGQQQNIFQSTFDAILPSLLKAQDELFRCQDPTKKQEWKDTINELKNELAKTQILQNDSPDQREKYQRYQEAMKQASRPFVLWQIDFARVFREKGGFDVIIGNPPYVSAATQQLSPDLLKNREVIANGKRFKTLYSKWDLYIPFMELGLQMLHKDAVFSMIVPYPLTNQIYAKKLRKLILEEYNMIELVDLKDTKVFDATVQNCIPIVVKNKPTGKTIISGFEDDEIKHKFVQMHDLLVQDSSSLVWNLTQENRDSSKYSNMNILGDFCYISKGMVLNADEKTAKGAFKKKDLISLHKDSVHPKKYIEGKDIDRFIVKRVRYLEWGTDRSPVALSRPTFEELYTSSKLLFNCLGELKVAIDLDGEFYCEQAIRVAVPWYLLKGVNNKSISGVIKKFSAYRRDELEVLSTKVNILYLLGIMDSQKGRDLLSDLRGGDYHIVPEHIRNIPVPLADENTQKEIAEVVTELLKTAEIEYESTKMDELQGQLNLMINNLYENWEA